MTLSLVFGFKVKQVRASLDINLLDAVEGRLIEQLVSDPILLCDVIFVLCQQEAEARGVTDEQFGQAMAGDAIDVMAKAMATANTDLTMLGDAFKFVEPMAKIAGVSLEEITAAIQLLSNAGIQGEMGGTTLRGMLLSLTSPSSERLVEFMASSLTKGRLVTRSVSEWISVPH